MMTEYRNIFFIVLLSNADLEELIVMSFVSVTLSIIKYSLFQHKQVNQGAIILSVLE